MYARQCSLEKILQQAVGLGKAGVISDPYRADVHRQFTPAASEEITADQGVYSMRLEEAADQVGFGDMPGVVYTFHDVVERMPGAAREQPCLPGK